MSRYLLSPLLLIFGCAAPVIAGAQTLLVGLHIQSERLALAYSTSIRQTDLSRLDLVWHEQLTGWLDGSVRLGKFRLTQDSNPLPAGQATTGTAVGLGLRFYLYRGEYLHVLTDLDYQYADSSASLTDEAVDMRWHQVSGQVQLDFRLIDYTYLSLAAGATAIHGDERASGTVTSVQSFKSDTTGYARLGLLLGLDPASHIGIEVETGSIAGGRIYFQRWF